MTITITPHEQEEQVKKLRRLLEGWRVALLTLKSVLLWEQQWHPGAILGSVTFVYLLVWVMDLNSLATIAIVGMLLNLTDFIVPMVCNMIYGPTAWTGQQEKMFVEICRSIVVAYNKTLASIKTFYSMRETSPTMYYIISLSLLFVLTWVASTINNTFLLYILTSVMLLWPGIQQTGIFNSVLSLLHLAPKFSFKAD